MSVLVYCFFISLSSLASVEQIRFSYCGEIIILHATKIPEIHLQSTKSRVCYDRTAKNDNFSPNVLSSQIHNS